MNKLIALSILIFNTSILLSQIEPDNVNQFKLRDIAPIFNGIDQNGVEINSKKELQKNKVILIFYRGAWCSYCMKHLKEVQDHLEEIEKNSGKVIVITSEAPFSVDQTIENTGAEFSIISDTNNIILNQFDVAYEANVNTVPRYTDKVIALTKESNQDENPVLPITSAYLINKEGKFDYIYFDKDYRNRAPIMSIINALKK